MCYELAISWTHESPLNEERTQHSKQLNNAQMSKPLRRMLVILSRQGVSSDLLGGLRSITPSSLV